MGDVLNSCYSVIVLFVAVQHERGPRNSTLRKQQQQHVRKMQLLVNPEKEYRNDISLYSSPDCFPTTFFERFFSSLTKGKEIEYEVFLFLVFNADVLHKAFLSSSKASIRHR